MQERDKSVITNILKLGQSNICSKLMEMQCTSVDNKKILGTSEKINA